MHEVNSQLYDFLKENETGLYKEHTGMKRVIAYVHVYFFRLDDFVKIIGESTFDEGSVDVHMTRNTIAFDLNDVLESEGHSLLDYKDCFPKDDWERWEAEIIKQEGEC